jgi:hypothetical protein
LLLLNKTEDEQFHVRLIHTTQEHPQEPYATLSHRWGEAGFVTLTRHNLETFGRTIPLALIPKTFMDAIGVSLQLGIRYLWIDSLCIMQDKDDLSDWLHEAGLMQKVYLHSHCNIFASVPKQSSEGLSRYRNPSTLYSPILGLPLRGLDAKPEIADFEITYEELWGDNVVRCPLNTRGWVSVSTSFDNYSLNLLDLQMRQKSMLIGFHKPPILIPLFTPAIELQIWFSSRISYEEESQS